MGKHNHFTRPIVDEELPVDIVEESTIDGQISMDGVEEVNEHITVTYPPIERIGRVVNCGKLNVREHPNSEADILGTVNLGAELMVVVSDVYDEYYRVILTSGIEGYCIKNFIELAE